jgi:hypothetical protein
MHNATGTTPKALEVAQTICNKASGTMPHTPLAATSLSAVDEPQRFLICDQLQLRIFPRTRERDTVVLVYLDILSNLTFEQTYAKMTLFQRDLHAQALPHQGPRHPTAAYSQKLAPRPSHQDEITFRKAYPKAQERLLSQISQLVFVLLLGPVCAYELVFLDVCARACAKDELFAVRHSCVLPLTHNMQASTCIRTHSLTRSPAAPVRRFLRRACVGVCLLY